MPLVEDLPVDEHTAQWELWSTTARLVVTEPDRLAEAVEVVRAELAAVELACSRFRPDSELEILQRTAAGRPVTVSPVLAELVGTALRAARDTDGDVDPTLGSALIDLGYDQALPPLALVPLGAPAGSPPRGVAISVRHAPGYQRITLDGRRLTVPEGIRLDLGATAKAWAADRCAELVAQHCGVGALVALGGDLATAGPAPAGGWQVLVRDRPGDPSCVVTLDGGAALATSSTASRSWRDGGRLLHHVLDPRTCQPADTTWRTVSVAAPTCVRANTLTTAALVRGSRAVAWLTGLNAPARLVDRSGAVLTVGGWPAGAGHAGQEPGR
jgi:thiamine biosynthesis lipoprotein